MESVQDHYINIIILIGAASPVKYKQAQNNACTFKDINWILTHQVYFLLFILIVILSNITATYSEGWLK